jgi:hypothetical protein
MLRGIAAAGAAVVLMAATPAPRLDPAPANAQTALVRRYVDALAAHRYDDAYALLDARERAYFRNAKNFASAFDADGFSIVSYALSGARGNARFRLYFARENVRLRDPARDAIGTATVTVPYGVTGSGSAARIKDLGHPWRAVSSTASATAGGLRVSIKKVAFYARAVAVVVTFANVGEGGLTLLPYGRSVLRDDSGAVYRPIVNRMWTQTDRRLFLGVHLAADAQVTGTLSFASPRLDDRARRFTLTVAPNVRDGAGVPFTVDVAGLAVPA